MLYGNDDPDGYHRGLLAISGLGHLAVHEAFAQGAIVYEFQYQFPALSYMSSRSSSASPAR